MPVPTSRQPPCPADRLSGGAGPAEARRLPPLLRRTWYALNQTFRRRLSHLGITPDQYTVLRILAEADGMGLTQSQLVDRMFSDPNTVASLVERMVTAGLLDRTPHALDRRAVQLGLTSPGRRQFKTSRAIAQSLEGEVLAGFSTAEREILLAQMERVAAACQLALGRSPRCRKPELVTRVPKRAPAPVAGGEKRAGRPSRTQSRPPVDRRLKSETRR